MLEKRYDHKKVEEGKYENWKSKGYFASGDKSKMRFSMVIPPPNVTGKLHLGHAWNTTIQDIIARFRKMQGYDVLWLPGMDHAGIATQAKVMERLKKEGVDVTSITREYFLKEAWGWKQEYADNIHRQWAKMGLALDYNHERFTLDEGLNIAVREVFTELYNKGLIYQGEKIINWDPVLRTALSNIEVIHQDDDGFMYYFKYPVVGEDDALIVATTRPETMFGDVCVVVNPEDERYKKYIGKKVINPANDEELVIIGDEYVDISFGTGAMKCTPAHDPNDFLLGEKYGLEKPIIMNKDATMNEKCGKYQGMDRFECRKVLLKDIEAKGLFVKQEKINHPVGHSERSGTVIEPMLSKQWFVKMRPLAEQALEFQKTDDKVVFIPERFENVFTQWMENIEDWCISRQLWWGHRIPAYYHKKTGEVYVGVNPPKDIENWDQDEDVLDTWFSSQLWPFSTLGWPEETQAYKRYFPTDVLVTAYDIIFFWVSRMIFQSLEQTKLPPFKKVVIHGLIRDEFGRKMSKSAGNGVDPMDVIDEYGVDALRYVLTTGSTPGQDMRFSKEKILASANYLNKIWNSARYVLGILGDDFKEKDLKSFKLSPLEQYVVNKLEETIKNVTLNMERYDFNAASSYLYNFVYDDFCSQYLEMSKVSLQNPNLLEQSKQVLHFVLKNIILLIYPYTPFIAEEMYLNLPKHLDSIMLESYPLYDESLVDNSINLEVETLYNMIRDVRAYKVDNKLSPNAPVNLVINLHSPMFDDFNLYLNRFAFAKEINKAGSEIIHMSGTLFVYDNADLLILNDSNKEELLAKLEKEISNEEAEIKRAKGMLSNPNFVEKAPKEKVELEKNKLKQHEENLEELLKKKNSLK